MGDGVWGSALGKILRDNGHEVFFWDKRSQIEPMDVLVIAIPTQAIRQVLRNYGRNLKNALIVNCAKGIEKGSQKLPSQIIREVLGNGIEYFTLIGASFAREVDNKMPTLVNMGGSNGKTQKMCNLFENDYFRVRPTKSIEALELAGALKNVYAIACGIADGLKFEENTRAKLITVAYEEFKRLASKLKYKIDKEAKPGILGDLVLTCSSVESRNFSFGKNLAVHSVKDSMKIINSTVEGYNTAFSILYFSEKISMPLGEFVLQVIEENNPREVKNKFANFVKKI